ncbi:hypothetical protein RYA99_25075 [Pseudomonas syringae pv. actinidifoliorum]|nr:hypothetical protein [Pseudomonas syringae pv. actinidifoliorum]
MQFFIYKLKLFKNQVEREAADITSAAANRLNFNTSRFDHVKDNRLKQWRNHEYKYDAWGNLIEKAVGIVRWQTFTYDCENRLVKTETMADTQVESTIDLIVGGSPAQRPAYAL